MEDFVVLGFALLLAGVAVVGGLIAYETVWKPRRRRRTERAHARSKLGE